MALEIYPLVLSEMVVETGRMTYLRNYGQKIWVPCPFFVISGGEEPVLVDTSASAELMSKLRLEPVKHVMGFEAALAKIGLSSKDIRLVIQTHLMYDHCGNSKQISGARFIVQKRELDFAFNPHPMFAGAYQQQLFEDLPFEIVDGDVELVPGIRLLLTPGHSPGTQSVAVSTQAGLVVITGFCCTMENFNPKVNQAWVTDRIPEVIPPGIHTDMIAAYDSALRVKNMADIIIPMHDPVYAKKTRIP